MCRLKPLLILVMSLSVCRIAAAYTDAGTLYVSFKANGTCPGPVIDTGYNSYISIGSYSPTGLTGGKTVSALVDVMGPLCPIMSSELDISGFSSNPGTNWLSTVTCGSITKLRSSATFSYYNGTASWIWSGLFGFNAELHTNVSCTITHN